MSQKTDAQLKIETDNEIKVNGNREITPPKDNALRTNIIDSKINKEGGNVVTGLLGYTTDLTPTDDKHIVPKKYVDEALAAKVSKSGDTMSGALNMSGNNITHVGMITDQDNIPILLKAAGYRTFTGVDGEGLVYLGTLGQGVGVRSFGSTYKVYIKPPAELAEDLTFETPSESG